MNHILSALSFDDYARVLPDLTLCQLKPGASLSEPGDVMPYVYFPNLGSLSINSMVTEGKEIEIASVGNEGMANLRVFLGFSHADTQLLVQVAGSAMRMESACLRKHAAQLPALTAFLAFYTGKRMMLIAQLAICNRIHSMPERCARWLLMTRDRVDTPSFYVTHEALAQRLGVRRPSVSQAAEELRTSGAIDYHRGGVTVLDRQRLELASCECYRIISECFALLPQDG